MSKPFEHGTIEAEGAYVFGDDPNIVAEYSRRFAQKRADGTYLVVTDCYVAESKEDGFDIHNAVEYMRCRDLEDVGGTEIACDYEYSYGVEWVDSDSILTADAVVKTLVLGLDVADYGVWED